MNRARLNGLLTLTALISLGAGIACAPPPSDRDDVAQDDAPTPLMAVRGQVSNALEVEPAQGEGESDELRAYLIWLGATGHEFDVQGALTANAFQLNVLEEPEVGVFNPDHPELAFAMVYVMSEDTAALIQRANAGEEVSIAPGTVFGISPHFVLFSTNDEAGDAILPVDVDAGFTLLGPDPEVLACQDEAYVHVDACIEEQSRCEPLLEGDAPDQEAYDACIVELPTCDEEFLAVLDCGSPVEVLPFDTTISVELQIVE